MNGRKRAGKAWRIVETSEAEKQRGETLVIETEKEWK